MIDNSEFCLVFYNEGYLPPERKTSRRALFAYQPNSGARLAYDYAARKNKIIINLAKSDTIT